MLLSISWGYGLFAAVQELFVACMNGAGWQWYGEERESDGAFGRKWRRCTKQKNVVKTADDAGQTGFVLCSVLLALDVPICLHSHLLISCRFAATSVLSTVSSLDGGVRRYSRWRGRECWLPRRQRLFSFSGKDVSWSADMWKENGIADGGVILNGWW